MSKCNDDFNVLVAGIGGQGVLLISKVLAAAALQEGWYACRAESRGLSQRGGSVTSVVRFSSKAVPPCLDLLSADLVLALDILEGCRAIPYLSLTGTLITNEACIYPTQQREAGKGDDGWPRDMAGVSEAVLRRCPQHCIRLNLRQAAARARCPKGLNSVLLGAAQAYLPLSACSLRTAIESFVKPQYLQANLEAFDAGLAMQAERIAS